MIIQSQNQLTSGAVTRPVSLTEPVGISLSGEARPIIHHVVRELNFRAAWNISAAAIAGLWQSAENEEELGPMEGSQRI